MAHYDIFRDQLAIRFPAHGHALWEPSPGNLYHAVGVGDVGYISKGRFHRLFNILLPADDPSHENFGVPDNHEPFKPNVPKHILSGILRPDNFCSAGVTLECTIQVSCHSYSLRPRDPGEVSFSCRGKQGAVLSLPIQAKREDTVVREGFGKWMMKHIDLWFAWIRHNELEIDRMEDIILVTGTDRTRSWANVAFLGGQADARVSFGVEVVHSRINWQFSPERKTGAAWNWGPSGEV
ncbi:hypothetical protein BJY52DRAFT_1127518 [Lactarius psammicola]|nr:hypothetical protein BJY52DRAFT_1127518 [Lactarius psammicola]